MPSTCTLLLLLPVHHTAANQSETEKGGTGELEHFELSVVDNKEDGDKAGDCTEQRHTKQHKSRKKKLCSTLMLLECYLNAKLYSARHGVLSVHVSQPWGQGRQMYSVEQVVDPAFRESEYATLDRIRLTMYFTSLQLSGYACTL